MKKLLIVTTLACLTNIAYAETSGVYLGGQLGGSLLKASKISNTFLDGDVDPNHLSFNSQNKVVFSGGISVGYDFKPQFNLPIRADITYTQRGNLSKSTNDKSVTYEDENNLGTFLTDDYYLKIKTRMNTLMLNTYYDIDTGTDVTPYVSLGAGAAFLKYEKTGLIQGSDNADADVDSKSKTRFAYSIGLGSSYKINANWSADISARYVDGGKVSVSTVDNSAKSEVKLSSTDILMGIRYTF